MGFQACTPKTYCPGKQELYRYENKVIQEKNE